MSRLLDLLFARSITGGRFEIEHADGRIARFGDGHGGQTAGIRLLDEGVASDILRHPSLGFGEAWMDGRVEPRGCTMFELVDFFMRCMDGGGLGVLIGLRGAARRAGRRLVQYNPVPRARRNVAHHYDLDGRLYRLFLDEDRQYSCAYFRTGHETLEEAQEAKKRHLAAKLVLDRPGLEVLDIGSGWGGLAITLARDYGCRVTGITLSVEQLAESRRRADDAGLASQIRFELLDYRHVARSYDRVVSVGMFEHVGIGHFDQFFRHVGRCLRPDGVAVVHAIGRADGPGTTNAWLDKYIFPGGYSPSLSETLAAVERAGLWMTDCEVLRLHYARTIALWRERFEANRIRIRALYDERFCRMFELYLIGAELSFRRQGHMNFQLQLARDVAAVPFTRDYMLDAARHASPGGKGRPGLCPGPAKGQSSLGSLSVKENPGPTGPARTYEARGFP